MTKPTAKPMIVQRDASVLRLTAREVPLEDIASARIKTLLKNMKAALHGEDDGVAIAAPQIGESLRIFVVNGETVEMINRKKRGENDVEEDIPKPVKKSEDMVFINPELTKLSKTRKKMEEGCLSVRWLYGQVQRSEKATIRAYNEHGKKIEMGASGLLAQIFQHEVDHLNGILFIDNATDLEDMPPEHHAD